MKILVTGAKGFVGRNLVVELKNRGYDEIGLYDTDSDPALLNELTRDCEFVLHLAGVNRPEQVVDFAQNQSFTAELLKHLDEHNNPCPIVFASSTQADLDNPYGQSKHAAEELLTAHGAEKGARVIIYRLPNLFGKWCRPNYNSAVATFCHNIAHDLPIQLNPANPELILCYIDDVVNEFIAALQGKPHRRQYGFGYVPEVYMVRLHYIAVLIQSFRHSRSSLAIPDMNDPFIRKLYSTYLTYLPEGDFSYPLKMNVDERGSFTEFVKTFDRGQVSINISQPGITKGNHWHHSKNEKFLVVKGTGVIRFRKIDGDEVIEYQVSGDQLTVVDIPPGYTHNITNLGDTDMVTVMWANEAFDPNKPDTYYLEV